MFLFIDDIDDYFIAIDCAVYIISSYIVVFIFTFDDYKTKALRIGNEGSNFFIFVMELLLYHIKGLNSGHG